jgi:hypothetical protein
MNRAGDVAFGKIVALQHFGRMLEVFWIGAEAGFIKPPVPRLLLVGPS